MRKNNSTRTSPDSQGRGYNRSEAERRATTRKNRKNDSRGDFGGKTEKTRCVVCGRMFYPVSKTQKTCSDECRFQLHRINDRIRYEKSGRKIAKNDSDSSKKQKVRTLTHRGKLKQAFESAKDALESLTKDEIESVERIMNLPHEKRWKSGACEWNEAQRVLARRIELRRIAVDAKALEEEDAIREKLYQCAQTDKNDRDDLTDDEISEDDE